MSNTIWVELEGESVAGPGAPDISFLLKFEKELDGLSQKLGVTPLSTFHDFSALADDLADEFDGVPEEDLPKPTWSDAGDGHRAVAALMGELRAHPQALGFRPDPSRSHWPAALLQDLEHCETVLGQASARGQRFRFLIVS